jgi:hypothetical protein
MYLERHKLSEAPRAGTGLHDWILATSRELLLSGYSKEDALRLMVERSTGKGREVSREISDALDGAAQWIENEGVIIGGYRNHNPVNRWEEIQYKIANYSPAIVPKDKRPEYYEVDPRLREKAIGYQIKPEGAKGYFKWSKLFCIDALNLCVTRIAKRPYFVIRPLSEWKTSELAEFGYMVPSPMFKAGEGFSGIKNDCNTSKRMYQIIEFDSGTLEEQWYLLGYLEETQDMPLAMVVFSGNKSLHGFFACYHLDEYEIRTFFLAATKLGADRSHRIPSQLCRVPQGWNYKTKQRQDVLYWNQEIIELHNEIIRKDLL